VSDVRGPSIGIIGAGPCGLTTLKNMLAAGLDNVVCYDEGEAIGGNWVFTDDPARTSVYECTHIISSKRLSEFEDFPMPANYPDYPSHRQMRAYFERYAEHFGIKSRIHLKVQVEHARRMEDGRWSLRLSGAERGERIVDHLLVCSGHHRAPYIPEYPGTFAGEVLHSRDYKRADPFRNKRVLVVGAGNSACDIAVDVARVAALSCLSLRRGCYIIPKLIFGRPIDVLYARARKLPRPLIQPVMGMLLRIAVGPYAKYGLPRPDAKVLEVHPTLNSSILDALRHGTVLPRPGLERFDGNDVHFKGGLVETFDTLIWATGFRSLFPFLDASVVDWEASERPPLYLKMMHPRFDNLFFIGLFQPIGCIWRLADHQARIAALQIQRRLARPADIAARIEAEGKHPHWRFDRSQRHLVEVDYHDFRRELMRELAGATG
jgi:cation diffusion facilitator CzcD-associated flavoprotein CzcO